MSGLGGCLVRGDGVWSRGVSGPGGSGPGGVCWSGVHTPAPVNRINDRQM